jgi:hypothetical protein
MQRHTQSLGRRFGDDLAPVHLLAYLDGRDRRLADVLLEEQREGL